MFELFPLCLQDYDFVLKGFGAPADQPNLSNIPTQLNKKDPVSPGTAGPLLETLWLQQSKRLGA